ncbi:hypothetical protein [Rhodoferax sp.]|uniref:hypothetical protein n=1 Tax=Rhodoferax sp. TaxID=50421 RepID=UPI0008AB37ED|nr:hypothetical protein [Rhodoferax sp.]MDO8319265.1 hypothetical protein [Rhodoferax sp.]MDP2680630.1 hypothetical protein [Rhodoferax sp.]OGB38775.1 MAG: hypothetical protein A2461_07995 [Burkholderiales bacterium RIFOXYC2_FULL_59_8]OGB76983.1 MAG: hypothetical protein A2496_07090 [Burkholderiales bacterium RIFOXYC12_FULL_60_6]
MNKTDSRMHFIPDKTLKLRLIWSIFLIMFGHLLFAVHYFFNMDAVHFFCVSIICITVVFWPSYLFSPLSVLFGYYGLWYLLPLLFAEKYQNMDFPLETITLAAWMLFTTLTISAFTLFAAEQIIHRKVALELIDRPVGERLGPQHWLMNAKILMFLLLLVCLLAVVGLVRATGGIQPWIDDPGQTFLRREGGGVFSILLMFSSMLFALVAGHIAQNSRVISTYVFASLVLIALSPFLGGKMQNFLSFFFLMAPTVFESKPRSKLLIWTSVLFLVTFFAGIYARNFTWITPGELISYSLNYFSTFELLVISLKDFDPSWFNTVFLPFNKFLSPFGIREDVFYDMSAWLTSIYYPENWEIRATEQWPIETDLYMSFYFVFGLPFVVLYMLATQYAFSKAISVRSLGWIFVGCHMSFSLMSHLRGGLILWNDLYTYPAYLLALLALRNFYVPESQGQVATAPNVLDGSHVSAPKSM